MNARRLSKISRDLLRSTKSRLVSTTAASSRNARNSAASKVLWAAATGAVAYSAFQLNEHTASCELVALKPSDKRRVLYGPIEPYNSGCLKVSDIHTLYYEESGNPNGKPVIVLHGGPGGGSSPTYRQYFDPKVYRIVQIDQRGSGQSTPHACLEENTTWHLVEDIEKVRKFLKIDKWQVFGGSWGSTLSLAYAVTHPERVTELVLRGIFLIRKKEIDWYYQDGASRMFPDLWENYRDTIPENERGDFVAAYKKRLIGKDDAERLKAAKAWTKWEQQTSTLLPPVNEGQDPKDKYALAFARIENHYFSNGGFFENESYVLDRVDKIRHIPTVVVQGRYDVVCPADTAWDLYRAFPEMQLNIVQDAGHSISEPGIIDGLVRATDRFGKNK